MLKQTYPHRDDESITMMMSAAETELGAKDMDVIEFQSLFMEVHDIFIHFYNKTKNILIKR